MARTRSSQILEKAQRRLNGLRYLNPNMDFGNGLSVENFASITEEVQTKLDDYNATIASLDQRRAEIATLEQTLQNLSERMLGAVASVYGKESDEYEMAGGVKRVRQRPTPASGGEGLTTPVSAALVDSDISTPTNEVMNEAMNGNGKALIN